MKNTAKNRPIFGLTFCCTVKYICETKKLHKCILAALVEAPEKQTFSLYVDESLYDKTDVIKSVKISLTQLFS